MVRYTTCICLALIAALLTAGCGQSISNTAETVTGAGAIKQKLQADRDLAIANARTIFNQEQTQGRDFTNGPCLSENLINDWVLDIVHDPRQPVDNKLENQCAAYRSGKARHFVEMDLKGNVVRTE